jgi:hypothetical protein
VLHQSNPFGYVPETLTAILNSHPPHNMDLERLVLSWLLMVRLSVVFLVWTVIFYLFT